MKSLRLFRLIMITVVLLALWQALVSALQLPAYILPGPLAVFHSWGADAGLIAQQAIPTITETLLGLALGSLFGMLTALLLTYSKLARLWFLPIVLISQAVPVFALAPLLVIWFGYGLISKIICTMIMLFFPVTSAFYDGLKRTEPAWLDLAKTMNASPRQILWQIRIPAALPSLGSGLRVAATLAPIGAIVGEWVGASQGLGYLMLTANARMQISLMFAALFTIIILTLVLYYAVDIGLKKIIFWQIES